MALSKQSIERAYQAFTRSPDGVVVLEDMIAQFGAGRPTPSDPAQYGRFIGNLEVVAYLQNMTEGKSDD